MQLNIYIYIYIYILYIYILLLRKITYIIEMENKLNMKNRLKLLFFFNLIIKNFR